MPTTAFKVETFFLTAEAETWLELEAMLSASEDPKYERLLRELRYKLWRTGHRLKPE